MFVGARKRCTESRPPATKYSGGAARTVCKAWASPTTRVSKYFNGRRQRRENLGCGRKMAGGGVLRCAMVSTWKLLGPKCRENTSKDWASSVRSNARDALWHALSCSVRLPPPLWESGTRANRNAYTSRGLSMVGPNRHTTSYTPAPMPSGAVGNNPSKPCSKASMAAMFLRSPRGTRRRDPWAAAARKASNWTLHWSNVAGNCMR